MKPDRHRLFDLNRGLEEMSSEEVKLQIQQLQQIVGQQEQKLEQYGQLIATIQRPQPVIAPEAAFRLNPEHIINQFRHLKVFNGTSEYSLSSFTKSVENATQLCAGNQPLLQYVMQIVFNEKIQGDAEKCIRRLGDDLTWDSVKEKLRQHYQPNRSYSELFNYCRYVKVTNLRELFSEFKNINYQINEMYDFDERKPDIYRPENVDRDLVEILIEKIDGNVRAHILENESMIEIFNKYARLKLLDDERTIDINHRRIRNRNEKYNAPLRRNQNEFSNKCEYSDSKRNSNNSDQYRNYYQKHNQNNVERKFADNSRQIRNTYQRQNSGQFRNTYQGHNFQFGRQANNSGQYRRPTNYFSEQNRDQLNNNNVEPMEIENIQRSENFTNGPRITTYP